MAHQITDRDNLFTVREPAWHGLGTVLPDYPTRQQAQQLAHPWEPVAESLYRLVLHPDLTETYEPVPGAKVNVRSDDGGLLGVVGEGYTTVTNSELYDLAEAVQGAGSDVKLETAGSLMGGAKVWVLLRLEEPLVLKGDDTATIAYYALQNSHDGSGSFRGQATATRIVCDNTARMADLDARQRGTEMVFRHSSGVTERVAQARDALAGWREGVSQWRQQMEFLLSERVTGEQRDAFVELFIPAPPANMATDRVRANVEKARGDLQLILDGPTCSGVEFTTYGLVQAAIEYSQHYRATRAATPEGRQENRFRRAYLEPSGMTTGAVELAQLAAAL